MFAKYKGDEGLNGTYYKQGLTKNRYYQVIDQSKVHILVINDTGNVDSYSQDLFE